MISVKEARKLIEQESFHLDKEKVALEDSQGRILADNVVCPIPHPYFDQSAVDGYGICYNNLNISDLSFLIKGEIKAGDSCDISLIPGDAIRIFTGAQVPKTVNSVIMQEHITRKEDGIFVSKDRISTGSHIRKKGEQIQSGETALTKGTRVTAAGIGFLASIGIYEVCVYKKPKIGIIVTGNEFAMMPADLELGKIYESNGQMLVSALMKLGISTSYHTCKDSKAEMLKMIKQESDNNDVLLVTGGVSVGDYDFTVPVLTELGFQTIFHKIRQKPGKPMYFGKNGNKAAFGLPGNPRSVMICFFEYVYPFINLIMGCQRPWLETISAPLKHSHNKKDDGKVHFLATGTSNNKIKLLDKQASHMLQTLALAQGIAILEEDELTKHQNELINVHILPS